MTPRRQREVLGIVLAVSGAALGLAAIMAPLPAGPAAIGLALLGARLAPKPWIGRTALAAAAVGTLAGFLLAFVITLQT